ncbi:MAG TPA: hypothetical protein VLU46_09485 [Thermoanaerobaculia bacterium]|nr:hypothetical protein [Thermoanaerobaculia bacterium]
MHSVSSCDYALILIDMGLDDGTAGSFLTTFREQRPEATTFVPPPDDPLPCPPSDSESGTMFEGGPSVPN